MPLTPTQTVSIPRAPLTVSIPADESGVFMTRAQYTQLRGLVARCGSESHRLDAGGWAFVGCSATLLATAAAESAIATPFALFALVLSAVASLGVAIALFVAAKSVRRGSAGMVDFTLDFMDGVSPPESLRPDTGAKL
jgi:hypothetical protein